MQKIKLFGLIALIVSLSGLLAFRSADNYFEVSKNLEIFTAVVKDVNTYYVDDVEPASLMRKGIDAMLSSLDPYTDYYSESEIEDYRFMTTGQYGGVGASIAPSGDYIMILEPYEGWPAQKAGLRSGDQMMEIDGKSMKGKSMDDVSKLLKGQPETQMNILIKRVGVEQPFNVKVTRAEIKVKNVPYYGMINKSTGYIKFTGFRQDAATEVGAALQELKKKNPEMTSLVFDLRGNPGGLLDEAIKTVNIFVDKGLLVVSTKGKVQEWNKEYKTGNDPLDTKIQVAVLIDGGSASAAEIVSGSLQDLDRAVIIGSNSFGKGLVQTTRPLPYNTQMKITTSKYYIPSGRCIQALDYSHKDGNGKAMKMPDSLRRAFKTKDGRTVYDGNGIKPDVLVKRGKYSEVVISLLEKRLIFDYANHYRNAHDSIGAANNFKISESDWQDFLTYLKGKNYEYKTDTETKLEQFASSARDENYYDAIKADFEDMEKKLKMEKHEDVNKYKEDIQNILQEEIAARYYYQHGRIEASFGHDLDIKQALNILSDSKEYDKIIGH